MADERSPSEEPDFADEPTRDLPFRENAARPVKNDPLPAVLRFSDEDEVIVCLDEDPKCVAIYFLPPPETGRRGAGMMLEASVAAQVVAGLRKLSRPAQPSLMPLRSVLNYGYFGSRSTVRIQPEGDAVRLDLWNPRARICNQLCLRLTAEQSSFVATSVHYLLRTSLDRYLWEGYVDDA